MVSEASSAHPVIPAQAVDGCDCYSCRLKRIEAAAAAEAVKPVRFAQVVCDPDGELFALDREGRIWNCPNPQSQHPEWRALVSPIEGDA